MLFYGRNPAGRKEYWPTHRHWSTLRIRLIVLEYRSPEIGQFMLYPKSHHRSRFRVLFVIFSVYTTYRSNEAREN